MLKIFLTVSFIFTTYLSADIHSIQYLIDRNSSLNIYDVKKMQYKTISNTHAFSGHTGTVWYKLDINNTTTLEKELFLHNVFAYYSRKIIFYEVLNDKVIKKTDYNTLEPKEKNKLLGSTLVHKLHIPPNSNLEVFIKNIPMVSELFSLHIYNKKESLLSLTKTSFYPNAIISFMFMLALYNFLLYFFNKRKEYLYYALYMITPTLGLLYKYGIVFNQFELYGTNIYWFNLTAIFMLAFLILFVKQVLNTKSMDKKIDTILNSVLFIIGVNILSAFIIDLTFAMELFKLMFLITVVTILYLIFHLYKIKHTLAHIFSIAYGFYFSGLVVTILAMSGVIEMTFFSFHSGGFGIILEGLTFSYLMHYNIDILERKVRDQRDIIIAKNKKAQLGDMISVITHQWKQPLNRIVSTTSLLEFKLKKNIKIENKELYDKIAVINETTHFLSETIDDFNDFFNPEINLKEYDLEKIIQNAIKISSDSAYSDNIVIKQDLQFKRKIKTYKNELLHITLNIIQNAKEAFKKSDEELKIIKIFGYHKENKTYIDIIDNAGGIDQDSLPLIFNENYTSKEKKVGSGLGLYLTKVILEGHLKGSIEASNTKDGAQFRIIL